MMSVGFNRKLSPVGAPLKAVFGSDIGHWDVMDARSILSEAYGLVDAGMITLDDFEALTWRNPVSLHMGMNPDYFKGTVIEIEAEKLKSKRAGENRASRPLRPRARWKRWRHEHHSARTSPASGPA